MLLLKNNEFILYPYGDLPKVDPEQLPTGVRSILMIEPGLNSAVAIDETSNMANIEAVEVIFADHDNGRGFSLAYDLRAQAGFRGEILAVGHLIPDQLSMLLSVGFSGVVISNDLVTRHTRDAWLGQKNSIGVSYQSNALGGKANIMARRAAARAGVPGV